MRLKGPGNHPLVFPVGDFLVGASPYAPLHKKWEMEVELHPPCVRIVVASDGLFSLGLPS